ncbi:FHA domain-containing protein [uncultured Roseovarius sp.]|uniref:FHA domain-containing protein n=1 Tax=uncultured Roseovarius sp. TaxID=293344 RepID=UPI002618C8F2|nr:FHA domain-containing protein [uncultured Roseovarius sp.]
MNWRITLALILGTCTGIATAVTAQDTNAATQYPENGTSILDCAPSKPTPDDSCTLRVPPGYKVGRLQSDGTGEKDPEFKFARQGSARFPDGLTLSATILLVDLSPGPNGGRRATFRTEKTLISEIVKGLPKTESVAIYGFNEGLRLLQDFTSDQSALLSAVDDLSLGGTNTLIGTFVGDSIKVLSARDDVVFRNIILVSDGQDEGGQPVSEIVAQAVENEVIISTLGTYWRPVGASASGEGIAYMLALADGTLGQTAIAPLQNPTAAGDATGKFVATFQSALRDSGLILPAGEAQPATISVTIEEPVIGKPDLVARDVSVSFTPASAAGNEGDQEGTEGDSEEEMIFGYPATYVYGAGAGLAALLLLLVILAARGKSEAEPELADVVPPEEDLEPPEPPEPTVVEKEPAPVQISGYLVFEGKRGRSPITGQRVNIGRSTSNDVVIEADSISRLHAQIYRNRDGGFSITDMDSLNGTYINDTRIEGTQSVGLGDIITFGKVKAKLTAA